MSVHTDIAKVTVPYLQRMKRDGHKITMLTAYDATFARLFDSTGVDTLLVGDSLGMVVQGRANTVPVTLDDIIYHSRCVARGTERAHIIADMPFGSYQPSVRDAIVAASRCLKEGLAESVKLEVGLEDETTVSALVRAGIPVMAHIGLRPQRVHQMGGYKIQGKTASAEELLLETAMTMVGAGAYALLLEGVTIEVAAHITRAVSVPTIGIGSGPYCDGQVLVCYDLLGLQPDWNPRFTKKFMDGAALITQATQDFIAEVRASAFPTEAHGAHQDAGHENPLGFDPQCFDALRRRIGFVPTMGCLHEGHCALLRAGRQRGDQLVLSIFVNPTQFGPNEDFSHYPRTLDADLEKARACGVDVVFTPTAEEMYPLGACTTITVAGLEDQLCGAFRPGHFRGVATVVAKLFQMVQPHVALLGEKDFQQLQIIRCMVADLNLPIEIIACPIVRESDGLAMSSRNIYLSAPERERALSLSKSLKSASDMVLRGNTHPQKIIQIATGILQQADTRIDYVSLVNAATLTPLTQWQTPCVLAIAAWVGQTRLIDNIVFNK
jgi:3-methyl-2-oxobutanoate hydroxymethyltransferase